MGFEQHWSRGRAVIVKDFVKKSDGIVTIAGLTKLKKWLMKFIDDP